MKKFVCKHPWSHFEVNNPNGDVTMCCNNNTVLGNVNQGSIKEIWNGEGYQKIRKRMIDEGAHAFCPHTCPVLQGAKNYENLDWYAERLNTEGAVYKNAQLNETEFKSLETKLESLPRRLRFAYSYACNLDCYHCYQREDATQNIKLPDSFMAELPELSQTAQVMLPFGGEPFLFKPVIKLVEEMSSEMECHLEFVTNATLLTDRVFEVLQQRKLSNIWVSTDAASAKSFDELRVRGRKTAGWDKVLENLGRLKELKKSKGFAFYMSMTLNAQNYDEIETFCKLALSFEAEPLVSLVSNPYQTSEFQKNYLLFTPDQFEKMYAQVDRCKTLLQPYNFQDAVKYLDLLKAELSQHRDTNNNLTKFRAKRTARKVFHQLPEMLQNPIRAVVQKTRVKKLSTYSSANSGKK